MVRGGRVDRDETLRGEAWIQFPGSFEAQQVGRWHAAGEIQSEEVPPEVHHFVFQRRSIRSRHYKRSPHIGVPIFYIEKAVTEWSPVSAGIDQERIHGIYLPQGKTLVVEYRHSKRHINVWQRWEAGIEAPVLLKPGKIVHSHALDLTVGAEDVDPAVRLYHQLVYIGLISAAKHVFYQVGGDVGVECPPCVEARQRRARLPARAGEFPARQ